ncbi:hypothetical protein ACNQUF_12580, partial [Corynebacterium diphtheriae]
MPSIIDRVLKISDNRVLKRMQATVDAVNLLEDDFRASAMRSCVPRRTRSGPGMHCPGDRATPSARGIPSRPGHTAREQRTSAFDHR